MATVKLATLVIRTLAKPISAQIKKQVKEHDRFRNFCISIAQGIYRSEIRLRTNLLGEEAKHIRPLSESRAIENGANALAEGFLFSVAAALIIGETWRSSRNQTKRREGVDDQLEDLARRVGELGGRVEEIGEEIRSANQRNEQLSQILQTVVEIGVRAGWSELQSTPLRLATTGRHPEQEELTKHPTLSGNTPIDDTPPSSDPIDTKER